MGLIACDEREISPTTSNKPVGLSFARATALGKDEPVALHPAPRPTNSQPQTIANERNHYSLHLKSRHQNNAFAPLVWREVCDKPSLGDSSAAVLINENKNEWIRVERRMRLKGSRSFAVVDSAGKFKSADVHITLFIYL